MRAAKGGTSWILEGCRNDPAKSTLLWLRTEKTPFAAGSAPPTGLPKGVSEEG